MEIPRGSLQLQLDPFRPFITPKIIQALSPTESLDPKVLSLADGSSALFLTQLTSPIEFAKLLTLYAAAVTLFNKLFSHSPKPLPQIFAKTLTLTAISCCPALIVKLALYVIRGNPRINMNDRKERSLYIISSIAIGVLMTPHFLKIHRRTYEFCPKGVAQYALAQVVVHIAVAEIFDWNDRSIAEEIKPLSARWTESLVKYQAIGPKTKVIIDQKLEETQRQIDQALEGDIEWGSWMDTAPIKEEQTSLPAEPDSKFATFVHNHPKLLQKLPIADQLKWNALFDRMKKTLVFPVPFPDEHLSFIAGDNLPLFHKYFKTTPFFFLLSEEQRANINQRFAEYYPVIVEDREVSLPDPDRSIQGEQPQAGLEQLQRLNLASFSLVLKHQFYSHETEHVPEGFKWSSMPFLQKCQMNEDFKELGLDPLPYW